MQINFNVALFRAQFQPTFNDTTIYSDALLQMYFDTATAYINAQAYCAWPNGLSLSQQALALNQMTAHLATINSAIAAGDTPGFVTQATIDKVSVSIQAPPSNDQWSWWLNQTPYGQQLLALLDVASVGGMFFGGYPVFTSFRH